MAIPLVSGGIEMLMRKILLLLLSLLLMLLISLNASEMSLDIEGVRVAVSVKW